MSQLVIMGSGETAPTMVRVHRRVFAATYGDAGRAPAVMLDTPFAFQSNAPELVGRTLGYFADTVGHPVTLAGWRRRDAPVVERERALELLHRASWAFAGPGSPTYALRQWRGTPLPAALVDLARRGGTLVLGSAAAVTVGTHAIPVYEIYKVGEDPHWVEGLDLLGALTGISAVVIPHYDNSEGGTHDTRFCYLGEARLAALEKELPGGTGVLGVDEHTALILDLRARTAAVAGNGAVTVRRRGHSVEFEQGATLSIDDLGALLRGEAERGTGVALDAGPGPSDVPADGSAQEAAQPPAAGTGPAGTSLRAAADAAAERFEAALAERDTDGCVAAVLDLEGAISSWRADTLQSGDTSHARRVLRALVVRLGALAEVGAADPRAVVGPYVELLLVLRRSAREARDFATSDVIRDRLAAAGVEVRDTSGGTEWVLAAGGSASGR